MIREFAAKLISTRIGDARYQKIHSKSVDHFDKYWKLFELLRKIFLVCMRIRTYIHFYLYRFSAFWQYFVCRYCSFYPKKPFSKSPFHRHLHTLLRSFGWIHTITAAQRSQVRACANICAIKCHSVPFYGLGSAGPVTFLAFRQPGTRRQNAAQQYAAQHMHSNNKIGILLEIPIFIYLTLLKAFHHFWPLCQCDWGRMK